ncbi:hypothetical protein EAE99_001073 [Botrytis elliptica]|nr:hypothetical protein EAE99_001073 [Botrytis elliptica]
MPSDFCGILYVAMIAASNMKFPPPSLQLMHPSSNFRQPIHPIIQFPSTRFPPIAARPSSVQCPMPNAQLTEALFPIFHHGPTREYQYHPGYTGPKKQFANLRVKRRKKRLERNDNDGRVIDKKKIWRERYSDEYVRVPCMPSAASKLPGISIPGPAICTQPQTRKLRKKRRGFKMCLYSQSLPEEQQMKTKEAIRP